MNPEADVGLILVAAGRSERMGLGPPKVFRALLGQQVIEHSLRRVLDWPELASLCVVIGKESWPEIESIWERLEVPPTLESRWIEGGATRRESVRNGLGHLLRRRRVQIVLVHDAARPNASLELFARVAAAARVSGAVVPALPVMDALRRVEGRVSGAVSREHLYAVQTPQGFARDLLRRAHESPGPSEVADDATLVEALGHRVEIVPGETANWKLTVPEDLIHLEKLMSSSRHSPSRVGLGSDLHRLESGGPLLLAGVSIPSEVQAVGHSDADAVLHAVTDAVLGAVAEGDLGEHFPDRDATHAGRDSAEMLELALKRARDRGYRPFQVDVVVHLERPKLGPHRAELRSNLARLLRIPAEFVSIKAKTGEGLGDVGQGRAILCEALIKLQAIG